MSGSECGFTDRVWWRKKHLNRSEVRLYRILQKQIKKLIQTKKETKAEKKNDKNALKEDNQIPEDGVITKEQMESIAEKRESIVSTEKRLTAFLIHGFAMEVRSKIRLNRNSK